MSADAWITLSIIVGMFLLLLRSKLPAWLIFMGAITLFITLRIAEPGDLLSGFSNSSVITVGALFIVAAGMYSTGAITLLANSLIGLPNRLRTAQLRILPPVAFGSAFLNNTPLVAMMIPVIRDLTRVARLAGSYLFMPMSFASILGGATTLIGTSVNLIIAGLVIDQLARSGAQPPGIQPLNIFSPSLVGIPAAVIGIGFMILLGKWLLPKPAEDQEVAVQKRMYKAEFVVLDGTALVGKTIQEAGLAQGKGYELIAIDCDRQIISDEDEDLEDTAPGDAELPMDKLKTTWHLLKTISTSWRTRESDQASPPDVEEHEILHSGDILTFVTDVDALPALWATIGLTPHIQPATMETPSYEHRLVEVVVGQKHPAIGRQVKELPVREPPPYYAKIVALSRNNEPPKGPLKEVEVRSGDNAILEVEENFFFETRQEIEFSLVRRLHGYRIQRTSRAVAANLITLTMVLFAAFNVMSMLNAALLAVGAMLLTGCINVRAAWRSIEWDTLVVLGAAIGLEAAVTASGLGDAIAYVLGLIGGDNAWVALAVVFIGCVIMTNLITNAAAAAFMFPIAVSMSIGLNINFMPFVIILMMGCSYAFINPAGYQTNLMVQGPGKYKFGDFVRLGLPLTIIAGLVVLVLAPLIYGF